MLVEMLVPKRRPSLLPPPPPRDEGDDDADAPSSGVPLLLFGRLDCLLDGRLDIFLRSGGVSSFMALPGGSNGDVDLRADVDATGVG